MEQLANNLILKGTNASGFIQVSPGLGVEIDWIDWDLPLNFGTSTDVSITLSGVRTGAITYHNDIEPGFRFYENENVNITTSNLSASCTVIIGYKYHGNQLPYMQANGGLPIASSLRPFITPSVIIQDPPLRT